MTATLPDTRRFYVVYELGAYGHVKMRLSLTPPKLDGALAVGAKVSIPCRVVRLNI